MSTWKSKLANVFDSMKLGDQSGGGASALRRQATIFLDTVVEPAFEEFRAELERHGRSAHINNDHRTSATLEVMFRGRREFVCAVEIEITEEAAYVRLRERREDPRGKSFVAESMLGAAGTPAESVSRNSLLADLASRYAMACALGGAASPDTR